MGDTVVIKQPQIINEPVNKAKSYAKKTYIEIMRIIAAFLVIVNHTNSDVFLKYSEGGSVMWFFSITYFFISKIAVPVFLMIMGGLLLQKVDSPKKSVIRVLRMVLVVAIYSAVYYLYLHRNNPDTMSVLDFFKTIFTNRTNNAFWYIYTYIGLLILLPIMQRMAAAFSKKATAYFVFLSVGVMGLIPLCNLFFEIKPNHYVTDIFFAPTIGLVFLGLYIEKHLTISSSTFFGASIMFVSIITLEVAYTYTKFEDTPQSYLQLDNWQYLNITASAFCFYIICKYLFTTIKIGEKTSKVLCYLGSLTFGIYLLSDLAIFVTRKYYQQYIASSEQIILITILWELVIFALCAIVTAILKLIPKFNKLI